MTPTVAPTTLEEMMATTLPSASPNASAREISSSSTAYVYTPAPSKASDVEPKDESTEDTETINGAPQAGGMGMCGGHQLFVGAVVAVLSVLFSGVF